MALIGGHELLCLTPKGEQLFARIRPVHLAANDTVLAPIAPFERKILINLLIRVIEGNLAQAIRESDLHGQKRG